MTPAQEVITAQPGREPSPACPHVRRAEVVYPGATVEIGGVRAAMRSLLDGFPLVDDVILCVCELATNAVRHSRSGGPGGRFVVRTEIHDGEYVWAEVEDQGGTWPGKAEGTACAESEDDQRGHGLDIVAALASEWGIDGDRTSRVAWFRIDWPGSVRANGHATGMTPPTAS
jgi:anti-sigma regulatory factor (Ser/Thr protein kinase)